VVSASHDKTLKVWDLATYACLSTHRGDASYLAVAAGTTGIVAGDSAGGIWFLDWPLSNRRATQLGVGDRENRQYESRPAQETSSSRSTMQKHTILFLAANPTGTDPLAFGEEARAIEAELERSGYRDCFELETRWAVQPLDLLRELRKLKPTVVHFSGHGGLSPGATGATGRRPSRDVIAGAGPHDNEPQRGLFFQGPDGRAQAVTAQALRETFGAAGASVKLVVLNACYSDLQAEALRAHVDCVVGMSGSIVDDAARNFAIGFYGGLGERESIAAAFRQGCAAISLEGLRDSDGRGSGSATESMRASSCWASRTLGSPNCIADAGGADRLHGRAGPTRAVRRARGCAGAARRMARRAGRGWVGRAHRGPRMGKSAIFRMQGLGNEAIPATFRYAKLGKVPHVLSSSSAALNSSFASNGRSDLSHTKLLHSGDTGNGESDVALNGGPSRVEHPGTTLTIHIDR
jgi:hypothetical protein